MKILAEKIRETVMPVRNELKKISDETAGLKESPGKWSKKEILGHLVDSAFNNHQRFVRAGYNAANDFPPYSQNDWVTIQHYNEINWIDIIDLFTALNLHISRVLNFLPEEVWDNQCNIGKEETVTIKFVAEDYLRHLQHHIEKILGSHLIK